MSKWKRLGSLGYIRAQGGLETDFVVISLEVKVKATLSPQGQSAKNPGEH